MNLLQAARLTDAEARTYLEGLRWPDGPVCPHCGGKDATRLDGDAHRPGTIQCNAGECRKQFTVTVGSVMESSKVPLTKWVLAFHLLCSSKKGISAKQMQRELGLGSYRTAWFLMHRVRHAMAEGMDKPAEPLSGTVEADETYVGGKPRKGNRKNGQPAPKRKPGRGTPKQPVMVLVERDGKARSKPVPRVDGENLKGEIRKHVHADSTIVTDEWAAYRGVGADFAGGHAVIRHKDGEYARPDAERGISVNTNTAESYFALLKRGHYGVYHSMSKKHLHRYCAEFDFRWNRRKDADAARRDDAVRGAAGKRLLYETAGE